MTDTEIKNLKKDQNEKKLRSFTTRLMSGIVLIIAAIGLLIYGSLPLFLASYLISIIGLFELYRIFGIHKNALGFIGYLTVTVYYLLVWCNATTYFTLMIILSLMALMAFYVFTYPNYKISSVAAAFMCICYAGIMMSYLYLTREMPDGRFLVWLILLSSWGSDTCAYCVGLLLGHHKMTPVLSPKKTYEGAVGGVIGAALLGFLFAFVFRSHFTELTNPPLTSAIACAIAAVISMIGDLTASGIKRDYQIKDYGKLIPGHGGVMDRFDSMMFTAPAIYFALTFLR